MIDRISITSREQWLAERSKDVTASVVGALRGLSPYVSRLKLYKMHTGFEFDTDANVRMRRGLLLESAIAARIQIDNPDWFVSPAGIYLRDPAARLGATPDFFIDTERGRGVLQTKLVTAQAFKAGWIVDGEPQVPTWIMLQTLTEAMLADVGYGKVGVWIDDPYKDECYTFDIERHAGAEAAIYADVAQFWDDVANGREPDADPKVDADLVKLLYPTSDPLLHIDLSHDNYLTDALAERVRLKAEIKSAEGRVEEIETELRDKMGTAEIAHFNGFVVTNKTQTRKSYTVKEASFRRLNIKDLRVSEEINGQSARF
jgi:predicted phage-related endonuclease